MKNNEGRKKDKNKTFIRIKQMKETKKIKSNKRI